MPCSWDRKLVSRGKRFRQRSRSTGFPPYLARGDDVLIRNRWKDHHQGFVSNLTSHHRPDWFALPAIGVAGARILICSHTRHDMWVIIGFPDAINCKKSGTTMVNMQIKSPPVAVNLDRRPVEYSNYRNHLSDLYVSLTKNGESDQFSFEPHDRIFRYSLTVRVPPS